MYRLGDRGSIEAAWQLPGKSFWSLLLLLSIWIHFFRQRGTSGADPSSWQLCSTRCSAVGLSAHKRLSVLAILLIFLHLNKRVHLLALPKPVQSGRNSTDRRLFFRNKFIAARAFLGNFLQTHSQTWPWCTSLPVEWLFAQMITSKTPDSK